MARKRTNKKSDTPEITVTGENDARKLVDETPHLGSVVPEPVPTAAPSSEASAPAPAKAKHYKVISSPRRVMHGGYLFKLHVGKIFAEGCYNRKLLERQGVVLKEVEGL